MEVKVISDVTVPIWRWFNNLEQQLYTSVLTSTSFSTRVQQIASLGRTIKRFPSMCDQVIFTRTNQNITRHLPLLNFDPEKITQNYPKSQFQLAQAFVFFQREADWEDQYFEFITSN